MDVSWLVVPPTELEKMLYPRYSKLPDIRFTNDIGAKEASELEQQEQERRLLNKQVRP